MSERDEPVLSSAQRDAWRSVEPPTGFAERTARAWQEEHAHRRGGRVAWLAGAIAVGVAALAIAWRLLPAPSTEGGDREVTERTTLQVGRHAIAVAEPGSAIEWRVAREGAIRVEQRRGDVFYRVDKGAAFVVATPAGEVTVRGTCFRVEVQTMDKKLALAAGVGALAATTVLVSVYEGRVVLANGHGRLELGAGERGAEQPDHAPSTGQDRLSQIALNLPPPPRDGATREELLQRDAEQRAEIKRLRAELEWARTPNPFADLGNVHHGDSFFRPPPEKLAELAKTCSVRWDMPLLTEPPTTMIDAVATRAAVSDDERREIDRVTAEFTQRLVPQLRAIYAEVTGDESGAQALSPEAILNDIKSKVPESVAAQAYWQVSHERAGLVPPSTDTSAASAYERFLRLEAGAGDAYEQALADVLGADRARALRTEDGGWGVRHSLGGCPTGN